VWFVAAAALALYVPLAFLGPGSDNDSFNVLDTVRALLDEGRYQPSRAPSYPVHEFLSVPLYALGGTLLMNLGTVVMATVTVVFFLRLAALFAIPNAGLGAAVLMLTPIFWVNAAATIDYVWATGWLVPCAYFVARERYVAVL